MDVTGRSKTGHVEAKKMAVACLTGGSLYSLAVMCKLWVFGFLVICVACYLCCEFDIRRQSWQWICRTSLTVKTLTRWLGWRAPLLWLPLALALFISATVVRLMFFGVQMESVEEPGICELLVVFGLLAGINMELLTAILIALRQIRCLRGRPMLLETVFRPGCTAREHHCR